MTKDSRNPCKELSKVLADVVNKFTLIIIFITFMSQKKYALETKRHGRNDDLSFTQSY